MLFVAQFISSSMLIIYSLEYSGILYMFRSKGIWRRRLQREAGKVVVLRPGVEREKNGVSPTFLGWVGGFEES